MKTILKTTIVVIGLGLLCLLGYKVYAKINYKKEVKQTLQTLPDFDFVGVDGIAFSQNDLKPEMSTVLIYFNSSCDYCQHEAISIKESINKFKHTQLVFISSEPVEAIQTFANQNQLDNYANVTFLSDPRDHFTTRLDATSIPYLLIYDQNQKLIKRHKGQIKASKILKYLNH